MRPTWLTSALLRQGPIRPLRTHVSRHTSRHYHLELSSQHRLKPLELELTTYETSRGNAENFPTAPPAHTLLCPDAPSISFAPVVRARHHLDRADRFASIGYGSVFRLKPFRPHLTMGALSCATTQPDTPTHSHRIPPPDSAQRGITPAFGYGPRLGPVRLDFHQQALCATRRTIPSNPTTADSSPGRDRCVASRSFAAHG